MNILFYYGIMCCSAYLEGQEEGRIPSIVGLRSLVASDESVQDLVRISLLLGPEGEQRLKRLSTILV
jgi:hypothetical protein